ncbi:1,6-anhydro-N-acetylmuramyl-L-alanine amidase AmpD [Vogesella sp. LIG4]|uniref:1,6-anhydro-N-acetylmuramyl-L-alanine amidase AmpD n=1 Tax=Vogesella sp. LIG4 TaxID=1192162 RepID=UPI00350F7798
MQLDADGWVCEAEKLPSPNCDDFAAPAATPLLVIHNISLPPYQYGGPGVPQLFSNSLDPDEHPYYATIAGLRVSCHFFIRRDGSLLQFVPTSRRAWHAGVSQWHGRERCNDFSLGIEMEGCDYEPFCHAQYRTLAALAALLQRDCGVTAITGHEFIAPGRKSDPGPYFDWARLSASIGRVLPEN